MTKQTPTGTETLPAIEDIKQYCIERDAVLRKLDVDALHVHMAKWNVPRPERWAHPTVPVAMMHKARLSINAFTAEEKEVSRVWLLANDYLLPPEG